MSKRSNINVKGTVSNLLDEGFDDISSLKEITDNSDGAGAKRIRFYLDVKRVTLYVIDDGCGMNKRELVRLATLNDRKEISEVKQGKYGQGVKIAFAYLTQLKGKVTVISKSNNYNHESEDSINQLVIDFPEVVENNGEYNFPAETACTPNKNLWTKYSNSFSENIPETGTLIKIEMDKRKFKELYNRVVSTEIPSSILYEVGVINYEFLSHENHEIIFAFQQITKNNEPEISLEKELDLENIDNEINDENNDSSEPEMDDNRQVIPIQTFDEKTWDVECEEEYTEYHVLGICPLGDVTNADVKKYKCTVIQNAVGDINTIVELPGGHAAITEENLYNLTKKPKILPGGVDVVSTLFHSSVLGSFDIYLAHNEDWVDYHKSSLAYILGCEEHEVPKKPTFTSKDPNHSKLLSQIKGHYYLRSGVCALNSRLKSKHTAGGDREKNKFEENIIVITKYPSSLDKVFGVTVKKYNTIEEIVHISVRNIIYWLKKRWATDYNNELKNEKKKKEIEMGRKLLLEKQEKERLDKERLEKERLEKEQLNKSSSTSLTGSSVPMEITDSSSESEGEDATEVVDIGTIQTTRKKRNTNVAVYVQKKAVCDHLKDWFNKKVHITELLSIVNFMCKSYELYKKSIIDSALNIIPLASKIDHLILEMNDRYSSDNDHVSCGSDFAREYKRCIEDQN